MVVVKKREENPAVLMEIQAGNDVRDYPEEFEADVVPNLLGLFVEHLIESLVDSELRKIFDELYQSGLRAQLKDHLI